MTDFGDLNRFINLATNELTKAINKKILERLFRKKAFRNPKKYHSCLKHYLSKTLHKNRI